MVVCLLHVLKGICNYRSANTQIQIHKYKYTDTNTQIQIHKYKYTDANTQIHEYRYTEVQIHKFTKMMTVCACLVGNLQIQTLYVFAFSAGVQ